jgi:hypothetical protein
MPRSRRDGTPPQPPNRHKLTDLFVKRQKPRARAFMIWDTLQRGFALSVQPTGHKAYKVVYSHQGRVRAGLLITTEAMVAEKPKKEAPMPAMPPGGGMDY